MMTPEESYILLGNIGEKDIRADTYNGYPSPVLLFKPNKVVRVSEAQLRDVNIIRAIRKGKLVVVDKNRDVCEKETKALKAMLQGEDTKTPFRVTPKISEKIGGVVSEPINSIQPKEEKEMLPKELKAALKGPIPVLKGFIRKEKLDADIEKISDLNEMRDAVAKAYLAREYDQKEEETKG